MPGLFESTPNFLSNTTNKLVESQPITSPLRAPQYLGEKYQNIAEHGIYGESGVSSIMGKIRSSRNFQRRALARSLRRRFGGRLGPRSGATDVLAANITYGGAAGEDAATLAGLQSENLKSKLAGIEGIGDVARILEEREQRRRDREAQGGGALGALGALGNIAEVGLGIATGGASVPATTVAKQL